MRSDGVFLGGAPTRSNPNSRAFVFAAYRRDSLPSIAGARELADCEQAAACHSTRDRIGCSWLRLRSAPFYCVSSAQGKIRQCEFFQPLRVYLALSREADNQLGEGISRGLLSKWPPLTRGRTSHASLKAIFELLADVNLLRQRGGWVVSVEGW
jgi:hypothetical protein